MLSYPGFTSRIREPLQNPQVRTYIGLSLTLVTIILLLIFAFRPALITVLDLNLKLNTARERTKQLTKKIDQIGVATQNYNKAKPNLPIVLDYLPQDPLLLKALDSINEAANVSGVVLSKIESQNVPLVATTSAGVSQSAAVSLKAEGTLTKLQAFFDRIDNLPRLVRTDRYAIELKNQDSGETAYTATINLTIFYQK